MCLVPWTHTIMQYNLSFCLSFCDKGRLCSPANLLSSFSSKFRIPWACLMSQRWSLGSELSMKLTPPPIHSSTVWWGLPHPSQRKACGIHRREEKRSCYLFHDMSCHCKRCLRCFAKIYIGNAWDEWSGWEYLEIMSNKENKIAYVATLHGRVPAARRA
jgi:hypothetical protein